MDEVTSLALRVDSREVNAATSALDRFGRAGKQAEASTQAMERSSAALSRTLAAVSAGLGAAQVVRYADAYQQVNARLRLVTSSQEAFNRVQAELVSLSESTRSSLTGTIDLYARIARSTKTLAASDTDRLAVTKAINQALIVSGASGASAEAALVQLGQGFASGTLRGEELNSVMEQTPRLAQAIADGLGITVGKLREMGQEGKLTSSAVFQALQSQGDVIEREFGRIPVTIGQALGVAESRLQQFIGKSSETSGAGRALASSIDVLSRNIDVLTAAAGGFATVKLAEVLLATGVRIQANVAATVEQVAALKLQQVASQAAAAAEVQRTAAAVASAQAEQASTASMIAGLQATQAGIVAARADTISKLQSAQAAAAQAAAQINAAKAAGALSFALAAQREGTVALSAAQARQVALTTELAVLGRQQASVQASIAASIVAQRNATVGLTAATAAQTTAQAGLATAVTATGTAATIASRALSFLGGPIGAITTLLGLGASAWILWGNSAEEAGDKAAAALKKSQDQVLKDLQDEQRLRRLIAKLEAGDNPDQARIDRLKSQADAARRRVEEARAEQARVAAERARNDAISRNEVARKVNPLDIENRQRAAFQKFMEDNATDTEKFQAALKEAKAELGDFFTPEVEARLRKKFLSKGGADAKDFLGINVAKIRQDLESLASGYQNAEQIIDATRGAGQIADREYFESKSAFIRLNADAQARALQQEIAAMSAAKLSGKDRLDNEQKIAEAQSRLAIIRADASAKLTVLSINEQAAAKKIAQGFIEAEAAAQSYLDTLRKAQQRDLDGAGLGTQERERRGRLNQLDDRYEQQRQSLAGQLRTGDITQAQYDDELDRIKRFHSLALEDEAAYFAERIKKQKSFGIGASEALNNYLTDSQNVAKQTEELFTHAFQEMEDALVKFVQTGKLDFKSLLDSIAADIIRSGIKNLLADGLSALSTAINPSKTTGDFARMDRGQSSGGGWLDTAFSIASSFFGGGRATGGPVSAGKMYEVNERRPELLNVAGRQYLMMGSQGGSVSQTGGGPKTVNAPITINVPSTVDRRTLPQIAAAAQRGVAAGSRNL